MKLDWQWATLDQLSAPQWHEVGMLRQMVFALEQNCVYLDFDHIDPLSRHLLGRDQTGRLMAYLRLVPAGLKFEHPSLGRVVTAAEARGTGAGKALVLEGLAGHQRYFPHQPNHIAGQAYLTGFYQSLGFVTTSAIYLEDGIEHLDMLWTPPGR